MTYVLEKITPEDQAKIILDAETNPKNRNSLIYSRDRNEFSKIWAINRAHNHYLLRSPNLVREDSENRSYLFYFADRLHKSHIKVWFGNLAELENPIITLPNLLAQSQEEVTKAFAIYGEQGSGPLNQSDNPEFAIAPQFQVRA